MSYPHAEGSVWEFSHDGCWVYVKPGRFFEQDPNRFYCWSGGGGIGPREGFELKEEAIQRCKEFGRVMLSRNIASMESTIEALRVSQRLLVEA